MRKRLSGLTAIGMTSFSALKRSPGCSEPSPCSVYIPISPSSALETKTNVAASAGAPQAMDSRTASTAAFMVIPPASVFALYHKAASCTQSGRYPCTMIMTNSIDLKDRCSAWIAWRLLFGRGPWRQGSRPLRGGEAALDAMVHVQNLVGHAIQALLQTSRCQHPSKELDAFGPRRQASGRTASQSSFGIFAVSTTLAKRAMSALNSAANSTGGLPTGSWPVAISHSR